MLAVLNIMSAYDRLIDFASYLGKATLIKKKKKSCSSFGMGQLLTTTDVAERVLPLNNHGECFTFEQSWQNKYWCLSLQIIGTQNTGFWLVFITEL